MDTKNDKRMLWFNYIIKLNDRTLAKQQRSGFTTWAILGILVIILYNIVDKIPLVINDTNLYLLLITSIINIYNLCFALIILWFGIMIKGIESSELRLKTAISRASEPIVVIYIYILFGLFAYMNIILAIYQPYSLPYWPYIVFSIIYVVNIIYPLTTKITTYIKMREEYSELPILSTLPIIANNNIKKLFENLMIFLGIIISIISINTMALFINNSFILSNSQVMKLSFEIIGLIILLIFLLLRLSSSFSKAFLDSLELRIILENLTAEEIAKIFIKEYLGETVRNWIDAVESKISLLFNNYSNAVQQAHKEFDEIKEIDINYAFEINGRRRQICDDVQLYFDKYTKYAEKALKYVGYLLKQKAPIADPEIFKQIMITWKNQLKNLKELHTSLCVKCKSIILTDEDSKENIN